MAFTIILISMINTVVGTAQNFYFKYIVGNLAVLSLVSMTSLAGFLLLTLMPVLTKKFGNRRTVIIAFTVMAIANALKYVFKVNVPGLAVCAALSAVGLTIATCMRDLLVIDCMKYGQLNNKNNYEGIYSSVKGFADKMALGLGSLLAGDVLQIGGFNGALEVQSPAAMNAISFCFAGLPVNILVR